MPLPLFSPYLSDYLDNLVPSRPEEMQRMEDLAKQTDFPIIGPASGYFCYLVARLIGARRVFEMGSGYGYSTAWFARAVQENGGGQVFHVGWDAALSEQARRHLSLLGYEEVITYRVGEAVQTLRETEGPFDLIFNDIDKIGYPESLPVIEQKLRPGGVLILDNMLWNGRVLDPSDNSPSTQAIRQATRYLTQSSDWIAMIVPIRDGLMVAVRK